EVPWHHQADDPVKAEIDETITNRGKREFSGQALAPVSRHETICDVDFAQFVHVLQTGEPDLFAGAFEYASPTTKAVSPVIRDRMIDQCLPSLFDIEQRLVGNETHHFRLAIQLEERFRVIF